MLMRAACIRFAFCMCWTWRADVSRAAAAPAWLDQSCCVATATASATSNALSQGNAQAAATAIAQAGTTTNAGSSSAQAAASAYSNGMQPISLNRCMPLPACASYAWPASRPLRCCLMHNNYEARKCLCHLICMRTGFSSNVQLTRMHVQLGISQRLEPLHTPTQLPLPRPPARQWTRLLKSSASVR